MKFLYWVEFNGREDERFHIKFEAKDQDGATDQLGTLGAFHTKY